MCGFAGFLSFGPSPHDAHDRRRLLESMGDAIAHRGPDDARYFDDGVLALVFRRLSIIDVEGGAQPIRNESGDMLIAANAEIYNHHALRGELSAHRFSSRSDCEVALHALEEWGEAALQRLTGMFAIAFWDAGHRRLLLARDRLGIKPLYVCRLPDGLLFGSELKALLAHPACPRTLDWHALDQSAILRSPRNSYVQGVELLPGGELLTATAEGHVQQRPYWSLQDHLGAAPFGTDAARYVERYAELLESVTLEHLQRDVGAGLHLSGGVDSSLLAAIIGRKEKDFPCFSIVERTALRGGDSDAAARLTGALSLPWMPVRFDHRTFVADTGFDLARLEQSIWMMDSPRFDLEWIFKEELHRTAKTAYPGLKVVLLGQGADEFAGGYSRHLDNPGQSWRQYLREDVQPHLSYAEAHERGGSQHLWRMLREDSCASSPAPYHRMMLLFTRQLQNHNLWHEDRSSSWQSLEARVPYLDHRLVELLASIPGELHEELFLDKRIVREAVRQFLPKHRIEQSKIAFVDTRDTAANDFLVRQILEATLEQYREKYMHDAEFSFDRDRVDELIVRTMAGGPAFHAHSRELLDCMSASIFEAQCRQAPAVAPAGRSRAPALPVIQDGEWAALAADMAEPLAKTRAWRPNQRVRLRAGCEILSPLGKADRDSYVFVTQGCVVGSLDVCANDAWVATFLRTLATGGAPDFTLQDWVDEFEIQPAALHATLDLLESRCVIELGKASLASVPATHEAPGQRPVRRVTAA
jgi:asparagine synthase (glutamine-hydrolysing)